MSVFFISDLHLGHVNMALHRGFTSIDDMHNTIITNWNKIISKIDCIYILGDITMEKSKDYYLLDELKGDKNIVLGNHDMKQHVPELLKYVQSVAGMINYKKEFILTHCPVYPSELEFRFKYNIHGHTHENSISDKRYINVTCEQLNYTPIEFEDLKNKYCKL